ncbi:hypothetical protein ADUPG1_003093, partial [Aduncisulcus paluster]
AQGLIITEAYYWDLNDRTRAFGKRFFERMKRMPTMNQAATYSATLHYLNAVKAAGTKETKPVLAKMRATPVRDAFTDNGVVREDGRMVHSMFLFEVKKPEESKAPPVLYQLSYTPAGNRRRRRFAPIKNQGETMNAQTATKHSATQTTPSLPLAKPESIGLSGARLQALSDTFKREVDKGTAPGFTVLVARRGQIGW